MKKYGDIVQLMTTYACTLSCPKCVQKPYRDNLEKGMMSEDEFISVVAALKNTPPKKMIISGGEPTLWPLLKKAIATVKREIGCQVEIYTNGLGRVGEDYGQADIVSISNYGSINKTDMLRLKKQLGKRVRIMNSCQVQLPFENVGNDTLPAICNCYNPSFVRSSVYRCPVAGLNRLGEQSSLEYDNEYLKNNEKLLFNQDVCRDCLANLNARIKYNSDAILEVSGWGTSMCYMINLGRFSRMARKIYRYCKGLK